MEGFCQIKRVRTRLYYCLRLAVSTTLVCLGSWGCSTFDSSWSTVSVNPMWFNTEDEFAQVDYHDKEKIKAHLFFDFDSYLDSDDNAVNFVVTTTQGSLASYGIDPVSGSLFHKFDYCSQKDIWKQYGSTISYPPFTEGVVPRILDQMGKPQKIYVFGRNDYYKENQGMVSHTVRIVGGIIEEYCPYGGCIERFSWLKRVVLIAVDPNDSDFRDVIDLKQLREKVDWEYIKAFMQNGNGANFAYGKEYPGFKVSGELSSKDAVKVTLEKSTMFAEEQLKTIRSSCIRLYDYVWKKFGTDGPFFASPKSGKKMEKVLFITEFYNFKKKYGQQFQVCTDLVQTPRIEKDQDRHWFFAHLVAFFKLEKLGYYYSCSREDWFPNPLRVDGSPTYDQLKIIKNCLGLSLNRSFPRAITYMRNLSNVDREHYRFIDYDNGINGTHDKLYSWVMVDYKKLRCEDEKITERNNSKQIFPNDVRWIKISKPEDNNLKGYIY